MGGGGKALFDDNPLEQIVGMRECDMPIDQQFCVGHWYTVLGRDPTTKMPSICRNETLVDPPEPVICTFDIETTKAPHKFPDANVDKIMFLFTKMISYMVNESGFLIVNRDIVSADIDDFEFTPRPEFRGEFRVFNEPNEGALLTRFFDHLLRVRPHIMTTYNGEWIKVPASWGEYEMMMLQLEKGRFGKERKPYNALALEERDEIAKVRAFRDRRYDYKQMLKKAKSALEAVPEDDLAGRKQAQQRVVIYDSLQLAHKCFLNSFSMDKVLFFVYLVSWDFTAMAKIQRAQLNEAKTKFFEATGKYLDQNARMFKFEELCVVFGRIFGNFVRPSRCDGKENEGMPVFVFQNAVDEILRVCCQSQSDLDWAMLYFRSAVDALDSQVLACEIIFKIRATVKMNAGDDLPCTTANLSQPTDEATKKPKWEHGDEPKKDGDGTGK